MDIIAAINRCRLEPSVVKIARAGWNGKGMFLFYEPADEKHEGMYVGYPRQAFMMMKTANDTLVPWLCSQTDLLADDWGVVP